MYCWKCGNQVQGESNFCEHCGADLRKKPAAPQPDSGSRAAADTANRTVNTASNTTAKPAKKKGITLKSILILALALLVGRVVGYLLGYGSATLMNSGKKGDTGRTSVTTAAPIQAPQDILTLHKTLMLTEEDGWTEYSTIFYGSSTNTMTAWTVEVLAAHSQGWTANDLREAGLEPLFPPFTEFSYSDEGDYACFTARMKSLKETDRLLALAEYEWIEAYAPGEEVLPLNADYLMESMRKEGWVDAPITENAKLHFD